MHDSIASVWLLLARGGPTSECQLGRVLHYSTDGMRMPQYSTDGIRMPQYSTDVYTYATILN